MPCKHSTRVPCVRLQAIGSTRGCAAVRLSVPFKGVKNQQGPPLVTKKNIRGSETN